MATTGSAKEAYEALVDELTRLIDDSNVTDEHRKFLTTARNGFADAFASDDDIEPVNLKASVDNVNDFLVLESGDIDASNPDFSDAQRAMTQLTRAVHYDDSLNSDLVQNVVATINAWNPSDLTT